MLRQLVKDKHEEKRQEEQKTAELGSSLDQLWNQRRVELAPKLLELGKFEIIRRAREAAGRGGTQLRVDLGVDEQRLRTSSPKAPLNLAEAVLSDKGAEDPKWAYLNRVGWMLQTKDGKALSETGTEFLRLLGEMGLRVRFTPFFVQDNPSDPFCNAGLDVSW